MRPDTVMNVASVSKTVTATAVMQLWEERRYGLQDDVGRYLPFHVRNPRFPDTPITIEQLLTHRSSIRDGPAYWRLYECGDPTLALGSWLTGYFTPGGPYWDAVSNWHDWPPGTPNPPDDPQAYTNVGFGLLGYLVETMARQPFPTFCRHRIFRPIGMKDSEWLLRDTNLARHATPYVTAPDAEASSEDRELFRALTPAGADRDTLKPGTLAPRCLYSFANYPDGSLRTSANDLARFLATYLADGRAFGSRLLTRATIDHIFSGDHFGQHLCWRKVSLPDGRGIIGHAGLDPGVSAFIGFDPSSRIGIVSLRNFELSGDQAARLATLLLDAGSVPD